MKDTTRAYVIRIFLSVLIVLVLSCANVRTKPASITLFGDANSDKETEILENYKTAWKNKSIPKKDIRLLIDSIPEGLEYREGLLSVQKGYAHNVIGKSNLVVDATIWDWAGVTSPMFPDYRANWKKPFCYWQRPLSLITLGLWVYVPSSYPCVPASPIKKKDAEYDLKKMAEAMDADLIVATYIHSGQEEDELMGANAFFIRMDPSLKNKDFKTTPAKMSESKKDKSN